MLKLFSFLRRFRRDEGGQFLVLFGLFSVALIATSGAVVDFTSVEQARTRAQVALDAAALALQGDIYTDTVAQLKTKAQALLVERLGDPSITVVMSDPVKDTVNGALTLRAQLTVPLHFVALVGVNSMTAGIRATATRGSKDVEVAVALDITYSMNGGKIDDLEDALGELIDLVVKDVQTPTYSKMALVPYSNGVNMGSTYAAQARGPYTDYTGITAASWLTVGSTAARTITAITKATQAVVTTSANHGYSTGDQVTICGAAGGGFTALNGNTYTITSLTTTTFRLNSTNTSSYSGTYTASSARSTSGTARSMSAITKATQAIVTTPCNHGLTTGDAVFVTSAAGGGFTGLNDRWFTVNVTNSTTFRLNSANTSSYSGTYTANSAVFRKCLTNECEVVVTSASHGLAANDIAYISNVTGMTQLNGNLYTATDVTANTFVAENSNGPGFSTYTSGGRSYCTKPGCYFYYFEAENHSYNRWQITNCVTERVGANQYTNAAPSTTYVGRFYADPGASTSSQSRCPSHEIIPLSSNKVTLHGLADNLVAQGSTAGHIGLAWAWYMLEPNFAYMWPAASQPEDLATNNDLVKVLVLMTDGIFNTAYCNGVFSKDYNFVGTNEANNCNASNGDPFDQAESICDAVKARDIILYTVGFDVAVNGDEADFLEDCATDSDHFYLAADGDDLTAVFTEIGKNISALRISQ